MAYRIVQGISNGPHPQMNSVSRLKVPVFTVCPNCCLAYVKPYFLAALPPGSVQDSHTLQIRSSLSLRPVQSLSLPFSSSSSQGAVQVLRLLTASPVAKSPIYAVTVASERTIAANEGSTIWMIRMRSWSEQIDELVSDGLYKDALALVDTVDQVSLPDKACFFISSVCRDADCLLQEARQAHIRALHSVDLFRGAEHDKAMNEFIELDINPARVIALFPREISGRLFCPKERWIPLFGGPEAQSDDASMSAKTESDVGPSSRPGTARPASPAGSLTGTRTKEKGSFYAC